MSTYNGEKYLSEQIDSIVGQSYKEWRLLIRDDGSNDETVNILKKYSAKYHNISMISDSAGNIGANRSFLLLAMKSDSQYMMFCDQDDIWHAQKIEKYINLLRSHITGNGAFIIHSDSEIVDDQNNLLKNRFIGKRGLQKGVAPILRRGIVQGSALLCNKTLIELSAPFPEQEIMYDLYLSLVCESFGIRKYIDEALMSYRQHDQNLIGASFTGNRDISRRFKKLISVSSLEIAIRITTVSSFRDKFENQLSSHNLKVINQYLYLNNRDNNNILRLFYLFRNRFFLVESVRGFIKLNILVLRILLNKI